LAEEFKVAKEVPGGGFGGFGRIWWIWGTKMGEEETGVSCRIFEEFERLGMIVENLNIMTQ